MANDVKNFLYSWCGKHKLPPPVYQRQDGAREVKANGTISNQPNGFHAEVHIVGVEYVGRGFHKAVKMAQSYAARNMVNHLCQAKRLDPKLLYDVPGCSEIADDFLKSPEERLPPPPPKRPTLIDAIKQHHARFQKGEVVKDGRLASDSEVVGLLHDDGPSASAPPHAAHSCPKTPRESPRTSPPPQSAFRSSGKRNADGEALNDAGQTAAELWAAEEALQTAAHRAAEDWGTPQLKADKVSAHVGWNDKSAHRDAKETSSDDQLYIGAHNPNYSKKGQKRLPSEDTEGASSSSPEVIDLGSADPSDVAGEVIDIQAPAEPFLANFRGNDADPTQFARQRMEDAEAAGGDALARFTADAWLHFANNRQDDEIMRYKLDIRARLLQELEREFNDFSAVYLFVTGSTVNGCGSYNSDMDLCLVLPCPYLGVDTDRAYAVTALRRSRGALNRHFRPFFDRRSVELIPAKVPILRLTIPGPADGIPDLQLDINCNNTAGIRNSHLLHHYSAIDERFGAMALLLKHWAIKADINDAQSGTLNSYSLILLLLHFLQTVPRPPVMPNLQSMRPALFHEDAEILGLELFKPIPGIHKGANAQELGALLVGFFAYYTAFPFGRTAISIRDAGTLPRRTAEFNVSRHELMIEEPYDRHNTARCVFNKEKMRRIRVALREAHEALGASPGLAALNVTV